MSTDDIRFRKVIAEPEAGPTVHPMLWAMDEKGYIREFPTPDAIGRWVRRRDAAAARRGKSTVTTIEWRDMPDGFVPPDVEVRSWHA